VINGEIELTNLRILIARVDLPLPMKIHRKAAPKRKKFSKKGLTCATQQAYTFTSLQGKRNIVQNGWQIRRIFNFQVLDGDQRIVVRTGWPVCRDTVGFYDGWRLLRKLETVGLVNCYLQIALFPRGRTIQRHVRPSCIASELVL
jgi:hypothetical protein